MELFTKLFGSWLVLVYHCFGNLGTFPLASEKRSSSTLKSVLLHCHNSRSQPIPN